MNEMCCFLLLIFNQYKDQQYNINLKLNNFAIFENLKSYYMVGYARNI